MSDKLEPPFPIIDGNYRMEKEPVVRIGIVLEEDAKSSITFRVPAPGYRMEFHEPHAAIELSPDRDYTISATGDWVQIADADPFPVVPPRHWMRIVPPAGTKADRPGAGVLVREVVAGRGFHWNKLIDQTLSDVIEFRARNNRVILVNELPLETYLVGVITGEMSGNCPIEFMKAQAVAARSWLLGQPVPPHPGEPFLWCNDDCCQRYQGTGGWSERAMQAIDQCRGEVLITRTNHYCDARYSKNTGGISEDAETVWKRPIEGLEAVVDAPADSEIQRFFPITEENFHEYIHGDWVKSTDAFASPNVVTSEEVMKYLGRVDEAGDYFRWKLEFTNEQLCESLAARAGLDDIKRVEQLIPEGRGRSGRLEGLRVVYTTAEGKRAEHLLNSEYNIRAGLSKKFLFSGAFLIEEHRGGDGTLERVTLHGAGWGHGAGLCQMGALGRAIKGQDYKTILMAYYSHVKLEGIYR